MNCNTTHYRANSSSVPGDPTVAAAVLGGLATLCVIFVGGMPGVIALVAISGFMSLMFPTIFGLGCSDLGEDTKLGASGMIMAIIGGALLTPLQGALVDFWGVSYSYTLPLLCFVVIGAYGLVGREREKAYHQDTLMVEL